MRQDLRLDFPTFLKKELQVSESIFKSMTTDAIGRTIHLYEEKTEKGVNVYKILADAEGKSVLEIKKVDHEGKETSEWKNETLSVLETKFLMLDIKDMVVAQNISFSISSPNSPYEQVVTFFHDKVSKTDLFDKVKIYLEILSEGSKVSYKERNASEVSFEAYPSDTEKTHLYEVDVTVEKLSSILCKMGFITND